MLEGFDFGTPTIANQLTGNWLRFAKYNAMTVSAEYFDAAMEKLRNKFLNVALDTVVQPASLVASQAATDEKSAVAKAPAVAEEELTAQQWFERGFNAKISMRSCASIARPSALQPDFAEAFYDRGIVYRRTKATWTARSQTTTKPSALQARLRRGLLRPGHRTQGQRRLGGALADYDEAIRLKPDYADAFCNRGFARETNGDLDGALRTTIRPSASTLAMPAALDIRANVRQAKGDLDGALADYNEAIRLQPDYAEAFNNRGNARLAKATWTAR